MSVAPCVTQLREKPRLKHGWLRFFPGGVTVDFSRGEKVVKFNLTYSLREKHFSVEK